MRPSARRGPGQPDGDEAAHRGPRSRGVPPMSGGDDQPRLKVDRLARAIDAARTRPADPPARTAEPAPVATALRVRVVPLAGPDAPAPALAGQALAGAEPAAPAAVAPSPLILTSELRARRAGPAPVEMPPPPAPKVSPAPVVLRPSHPKPQPDRPAGPAPRPRFGTALLSVEGASTETAPVLSRIALDVPTGAVTVLAGVPSAGSGALLRAIMGLGRLSAGRVRLDGQDITLWRPDRIARAGVGYLPAGGGLFPVLSVAENLRLGSLTATLPRDRLDTLFRLFPALKPVWTRPAGTLDPAAAQALALARLMAERRRLYLVEAAIPAGDPPAALTAALLELKLQGATILLATDNLPLAAELGDLCVALAAGQVVWTGPMAVWAEDADLRTRCAGSVGAAG